MVGVDGELGVDEDKDGLLDGVKASEGSAIRAAHFHFHLGFRIYVYAEQNVLVAYSARSQAVPRRSS